MIVPRGISFKYKQFPSSGSAPTPDTIFCPTAFKTPLCPIYQDVDAKPHTNPEEIKSNLIAQLTSPVRWSQIIKNMAADGFTEFIEVGPGTVLQGLIKKTVPAVEVSSATL